MILTKSKIFLFCCLAIITGIGIASYLPDDLIIYDLYFFAAAMAGLAAAILFWKIFYIRLCGLIFLCLFLGIWRFSAGLPDNAPDNIWHFNGEKISLQGIIVEDPDIRNNNIKITVGALHPAFSPETKGKILITTSRYPEYKYGDELEIECDLKAPEAFSGFAYDRYLARHDIYSVCYYPEVKKISGNKGNAIYAAIFKTKDKLRGTISRNLKEPSAGLARAIVLGDKRAIDDDLRLAFSQAGISHIAAISGMHISLLGALILGLFFWLGLNRRQALWAGSLVLFAYILLIGLPASAMRAGLMGFLVMLALSIGRLSRMGNVLVLTAAILLLINPRLLRDDIGFQLSFLAVSGILLVYPFFGRFLHKLKQYKSGKIIKSKPVSAVFDVVFITVAVQVLTLPIIAINFNQFSLVAPIANLAVLWSLPFIIVSVLGGMFLSLIIPGLGPIFFLPAQILLDYIAACAQKTAGWPGAYWETGYILPLWWALYYLIISFLLIYFQNKRDDNLFSFAPDSRR